MVDLRKVQHPLSFLKEFTRQIFQNLFVTVEREKKEGGKGKEQANWVVKLGVAGGVFFSGACGPLERATAGLLSALLEENESKRAGPWKSRQLRDHEAFRAIGVVWDDVTLRRHAPPNPSFDRSLGLLHLVNDEEEPCFQAAEAELTEDQQALFRDF